MKVDSWVSLPKH